MAETWAKKEYTNLLQAYEAGVHVPKPESYRGNVLVMEFIGRNRGTRALTLHEVAKSSTADYRQVLNAMKLLYSQAGLVHADLSEYNMFKVGERIVLFDFGSAVSIEHPSAKEFLVRDIENVNKFFYRMGIRVRAPEELVSEIQSPFSERSGIC